MRADGSDGVNEVSYLMLDVIEEMRLLQPSSSIQVSKKSPDAFIKRAARIMRTGFGRLAALLTGQRFKLRGQRIERGPLDIRLGIQLPLQRLFQLGQIRAFVEKPLLT